MLRPVVPVFFLLLAGCGSLNDYDVTLNDRVLYTPRALSADPSVVDSALATCVTQTLADQGIKSVGALEALNCSQAGITRLDGLSVYRGLKQLGLAGNDLRSAKPLTALKSLTLLDLRENPQLDCDGLADITAATVLRPAHCNP